MFCFTTTRTRTSLDTPDRICGSAGVIMTLAKLRIGQKQGILPHSLSVFSCNTVHDSVLACHCCNIYKHTTPQHYRNGTTRIHSTCNMHIPSNLYIQHAFHTRTNFCSCTTLYGICCTHSNHPTSVCPPLPPLCAQLNPPTPRCPSLPISLE